MAGHVKLIGLPPRPESGEGEIVVEADGVYLTFVYQNYDLVDVKPYNGTFAVKYAKLQMKLSEDDDIPFREWCCVQDEESGTYVCWAVRLDSGCP